MSVIRDLFTSSVNSTMMSINERFTYLQKNVRPVQTTVMTIRANNSARQQASAKNRRLAMQMESRLSAMAALKLKKKSIRQRLGVPLVHLGQGGNVRDRLSLPGRGKSITRNKKKNRGRNLRRASSIHFLPDTNMRRSRSVQSLNEVGIPRRSRSRSRPRSRAPSVVPAESVLKQRSASAMRQGRLKKGLNSGFFNQQIMSPQKRKRSNSINFRNRRARNIGNQGVQKEQKNLIFRRGGGRGRNGGNVLQMLRGQASFGGGRGGRGRGRGDQVRNVRLNRNAVESIPTKEELDKELEQYMANTKSQLDKDIDSYMKENMEMAALRN